MKDKKIHTKLSKHYFGTIVVDDYPKLTNAEACLTKIINILQDLQVQYLGDLVHIFPNKSYTILLNLAESHISIHTWPERQVVQLDVFLCNYMHDNSKKCQGIFEAIMDYFEPVEKDFSVVERL